MHNLSPVTDNCPTWISSWERMAIEIISWPISTKEYFAGQEDWALGHLNTRRTCIRPSYRAWPASLFKVTLREWHGMFWQECMDMLTCLNVCCSLMSHRTTKPTKWSVRTSAQSDQSFLSAWRNIGSIAMPRLIRVFARCTCHFVGFVMLWLIFALRRSQCIYCCTCF